MATFQGTWSLARCNLSVAGVNINAGAGSGGYVSITGREDWRTVTVGLQGDTVVNERLDRSADVEITLSQKATANASLQALLNRRLTQDGDVGLGPFIFEELDGGTVITGDVVLTAPPEFTAEGEVGDVTWAGIILDCDWKVGG